MNGGGLKSGACDAPPHAGSARRFLPFRKAEINSRNSTYRAIGYLVADERAGMNLNFGAGALGVNSSSLVPIETAGNVTRFHSVKIPSKLHSHRGLSCF